MDVSAKPKGWVGGDGLSGPPERGWIVRAEAPEDGPSAGVYDIDRGPLFVVLVVPEHEKLALQEGVKAQLTDGREPLKTHLECTGLPAALCAWVQRAEGGL